MSGSGTALRFRVGQEVLCRTGEDEWSLGNIVALWYKEPSWPKDRVAPYQVQLTDGRLIFVPADVPQLCRLYAPPSWVQAVKEEDLAKLEAAVKKGCEEGDHLGRTPLLSCVESGWQKGASFLLTRRADVSKSFGPEKNTALHLAVLPLGQVCFTDGDNDSVLFSRESDVISARLVKDGNPDEAFYEEQVTSIVYDESEGKLTWIGIPEEGETFSHLQPSLRAWVPGRLAALVQRTAVNTTGLPTPQNARPVVQALLQAKAAVNVQNEDPDNDLDNFTSLTHKDIEQRAHRSALHYAAESGEAGICALLLSSRASINIQDRFKMTPLDAALDGGSKLVADILLRKAADPNQGNMHRGMQQTALHEVSDNGNAEFAKLIVDHGGQVNLAGKNGMTALHLAARKKHVGVVEVLLNAGADVSVIDKFGLTAAKYAEKNKSPELAEALALDMQLSDRVSFIEKAKGAREQQEAEEAKRRQLLESLDVM